MMRNGLPRFLTISSKLAGTLLFNLRNEKKDFFFAEFSWARESNILCIRIPKTLIPVTQNPDNFYLTVDFLSLPSERLSLSSTFHSVTVSATSLLAACPLSFIHFK